MKDNVKQQRDTRQRREVYDAVMHRCDHPNADDIYLELRTTDNKISKGTVYRNLNILSDNEEIMHVKVPNGSDRFDSRLDNHIHIICLHCGKVIDAPIEYVAEFDSEVEKCTGFLIRRHRTVFEGICPECIAKEKEQ